MNNNIENILKIYGKEKVNQITSFPMSIIKDSGINNFLYSNPKNFYDEEFHKDFNNFNFRSDEFIKNHDKKHLLFMGCSETQGSNHSLEETWSYILYKKINQNKEFSGYFNIAVNGSGLQIQFMILLEYIKNFGKPDQILLLLPETLRPIGYDFNNFKQENLSSNKDLPKDIVNSHLTDIMLLKIFECFCKLNNIKFLWSSWCDEEESLLSFYNFENYFSMNMSNIQNVIVNNFDEFSDNTKSLSYNLKKSDGHKGVWFHNYWASKFYERLINEKNI